MDKAIITLNEAGARISAELVPHVKSLISAAKTASTIASSKAPHDREALEELGGALGDLGEAAEGTSTFHILHHHLAALAAASEAFMWLTDPDPTKAVDNARNNIAQHIAALQAKKETHADFADGLTAFLNAIHDDVKKNHPEPLVWA